MDINKNSLSFVTAFLIVVALFVAAFFSFKPTSAANAKSWTPNDRWFYVSKGLGSEEAADEVVALVERAAKANLNGMLWSIPWDGRHGWNKTQTSRYSKVKEAADKANVEIIPILWSVGYGTMISKNPNLAEGLPIKDLPMVVKDGKASFFEEPIKVKGGDLETWKDKRVDMKGFHDKPGEVSFRDDEIVRGGTSSIRFEHAEDFEHGHGRLMYELELPAGRVYRATVWHKAEKLLCEPRIQAYSMSGASLADGRSKAESSEAGSLTCDWTPMSCVFRVPEDGKARVYMGLWGSKGGKLWFDDFTIEPLGFVNPLQRPGTPIVVTSADGKTTYEQGKDWEISKFTLRPWNPDSESQTLTILDGSKIKDGDELSVDFYYPPLVGAPQIGTCMSEPDLYEHFEASAKAIAETLKPKKWFLSMDEIRCAGTCKACKDRGISLAAILGDCVTKQYEICKKYTPDADVYIWSDMLDPNHNAHADYYVCDGDYTGVWDLVPKDLVISCWYFDKREESMKFFSERGFRTQAAAYYDADNLDSCKEWLEVCKRTPGCTGIMYTTWRNKYDLMEDFGKLIDEK